MAQEQIYKMPAQDEIDPTPIGDMHKPASVRNNNSRNVPPKCAAIDVDDVLPEAPCTIVLTFGSISMVDFVDNWVSHVTKIPSLSARYLVLALDDDMYQHAKGKQYRALPAASLSSRSTTGNSKKYVFWNRPAFRALVLDKVRLYSLLLSCGYSLLATDADTVWLSEPWPYVGPPPGVHAKPAKGADDLWTAEVLVSVDENFIGKDLDPRLALQDFNTGMLFLRSTPATVAFVFEWAFRIETSDADWCDDQSEFNRILRGIYPRRSTRYSHKRTAGTEPIANYEAWPYIPVKTLIEHNFVQHFDQSNITSTFGQRNLSLQPVLQWPLDRVRRELSFPMIEQVLKKAVLAGNRSSFSLWNGRISLATLPLASFAGGHLYFTERVPQTLGIVPAVVHATFQFGDSPQYATGKRQRMREANLWASEDTSYFEQGFFIRVVDIDAAIQASLDVENDDPKVWQCDDEEDSSRQPTITAELAKCFHPERRLPDNGRKQIGAEIGNLDPAIPHIKSQLLLRAVLRNAFALAEITNRIVILPHMWCFCMRHWWYLKKCTAPWHDQGVMPLPFRCPMDHNFDIQFFTEAKLKFREHSFLASPRVPWALRDSIATISLKPPPNLSSKSSLAMENSNRSGLVEWSQAGRVLRYNVCEVAGSNDTKARMRCEAQLSPRLDDIAGVLAVPPLAQTRVLDISARHLLRVSDCGYYDVRRNAWLHKRLAMAFHGRLQYCSEERNEGTADISKWARANGLDAYRETVSRFNCTGTDPVEKPQIDLKSKPFLPESSETCSRFGE